MVTRAGWRKYEELICSRLRRQVGDDAAILFDQSVVGRASKCARQVDIYVSGRFRALGNEPLTMAVDCKLWNRRVAVGHVDCFIGFVDDVGCDLGLLVTNVGFSEAARARAEGARGIKVDVVRPQEIDLAFHAYCLKCRTQRLMKDVEAVTMRNGRLAMRGQCAVCGNVLYRVGG